MLLLSKLDFTEHSSDLLLARWGENINGKAFIANESKADNLVKNKNGLL